MRICPEMMKRRYDMPKRTASNAQTYPELVAFPTTSPASAASHVRSLLEKPDCRSTGPSLVSSLLQMLCVPSLSTSEASGTKGEEARRVETSRCERQHYDCRRMAARA